MPQEVIESFHAIVKQHNGSDITFDQWVAVLDSVGEAMKEIRAEQAAK